MNITWEKLVLWILGIIVALIIIGFLVYMLGPGDQNIVKQLFATGSQATDTGLMPVAP